MTEGIVYYLVLDGKLFATKIYHFESCALSVLALCILWLEDRLIGLKWRNQSGSNQAFQENVSCAAVQQPSVTDWDKVQELQEA